MLEFWCLIASRNFVTAWPVISALPTASLNDVATKQPAARFYTSSGSDVFRASNSDPISSKSAGIRLILSKIPRLCNLQKFGVETLLNVPKTLYPFDKRSFERSASWLCL